MLFLGRIVAEVMDEVDLPFRGAVIQVGWIEGGFPQYIVRIGSTEVFEGDVCRREWNGLLQEFAIMPWRLLKNGAHLIDGIVFGGAGARRHQLRLLQHLLSRVVHQE